MKLVRYGPPGREKPGLIDADGVLRDLSRKVTDIDGESLAPASLSALRKLDVHRLPAVKGRPRLGPCVATPSKFVAIGLNYIDHAKETGSPIPENPIVFFKSPTCIVGANDNIMLPPELDALDWEVELGVVIGRTARYVDEGCDALRRRLLRRQRRLRARLPVEARRSQWSKGKGCDTFGPTGPYLVTSDEIKDPQNLDMWLDVNGERRQTGNTRTMIFGVAQLVADVIPLHDAAAGRHHHDGHAAGRGTGMKPPQYLKAGDVVTLGIEGLGRAAPARRAFKGRRPLPRRKRRSRRRQLPNCCRYVEK